MNWFSVSLRECGRPSCRNVLAYCAHVDFDEALTKLDFEPDTAGRPAAYASTTRTLTAS